MPISVVAFIHAIARRLEPVYERAGYKRCDTQIMATYNNAWRILEYITQKSKEQLIIQHSITVDSDLAQQLEDVLKCVIHDALPLAYILGTISFTDLTLATKAPVLIPRPETEEWCSRVIDYLKPYVAHATIDKPFRILDLCTGSGCIALAVAHAYHNVHVVAVDNAPHALELAQYNAKKNNIKNCSFILSDLFKELSGQEPFDAILTNPPYIRPHEFSTLDLQSIRWEDRNALVANDNGLELVKRIIHEAPRFLRDAYNCGQIWCEIGYTQAQEVTALFCQHGFKHVKVMHDAAGCDRVIHAQLY